MTVRFGNSGVRRNDGGRGSGARRFPSLFLLRRVQVRDGAFEHLCGEGDGFRQRGMGMDGESYVLGVRAHFYGVGDLGDEVAGVGADDAGADDALGFIIEDQLGQALAAAQAQ